MKFYDKDLKFLSQFNTNHGEKAFFYLRKCGSFWTRPVKVYNSTEGFTVWLLNFGSRAYLIDHTIC